MESTLKRTWAEIDIDALKHNYRTLRKKTGEGVKFLGVVKADAYGHGSVVVARTLEKEGADYLAVSSIDEAMELRVNGIKMPILILGHTPKEQVERLIEYDITQAVTCKAKAVEYSQEASKIGRELKIHIKVDTGMSRLGYLCNEEYFDTGDYRIYYSTWPLADENGEDFTDYYIFGGCRPIKKHFWGYTRDHCDSYMVFIDNKYVAMLHTIKGENGYYNFINYSFYVVGDFQTRFTIKDEGFDERIFSIDQVYVNGIDSPLTDEFDLEYGEVCEVQKGFFFVSSEQVQSFYIGDVQFNVDTRFVCDSLY